ncbi:hypothetical protein Hanom_Chr11g01003001 [Helianthus anomalus]
MFSKTNTKFYIALNLFFKHDLITFARFHPFFTSDLGGFQLLFTNLVFFYHSLELSLGYDLLFFEPSVALTTSFYVIWQVISVYDQRLR